MIKQIIDKLFCLHDWVVLQQTAWTITPANGGLKRDAEVTYYTCKKCGKIKGIKIGG